MSTNSCDKSIARAYALAIFRMAQSTQSSKKTELHNNTIDYWSSLLNIFAIIAQQLKSKTTDPSFTIDSGLKLFTLLADIPLSVEATRFLKLLLEKRQLTLLTSISTSFQQICLNHSGKKLAKIEAVQELTHTQQKELTNALAQKFNCQIELQYVENLNLIGGLVVYVDDYVFDGSVRGWLNKAQIELQKQ